MEAEAKVMADGPQVAAVGAEALQFGSNELQLTSESVRKPLSPSWALRATPRGSVGPPEPMPAGRVAKFRLSPGAPTEYGTQVVPRVVGGEVAVFSRVACTS